MLRIFAIVSLLFGFFGQLSCNDIEDFSQSQRALVKAFLAPISWTLYTPYSPHQPILALFATMTTTTAGPTTGQLKTIRIATFNIMNGRGSGLQLATRALKQMNVDVAVVTETKVTNNLYAKSYDGYNIRCSMAISHNQGGIALITRETDLWQIESERTHGHNVMSFEIVSGNKRTPVIGAYIPPSEEYARTLGHLECAMARFEDRSNTVIVGDLNSNLESPRTFRAAEIADTVIIAGFRDCVKDFKQRSGHSPDYSWRSNSAGGTVTARCDYILSRRRSQFKQVAFRTPRQTKSDHKMVIGDLTNTMPRSMNLRYLRGRKKFPLSATNTEPLTLADTLFHAVDSNREKSKQRTRVYRHPWVSAGTWLLVDQRAEKARSLEQLITDHDNKETAWTRGFAFDCSDRKRYIRHLSRRIKASFKVDRRRRAATAGDEVESLLKGGDIKEAYARLSGWYRESSVRPPKPSRADLEEFAVKYTDLYAKRRSPGLPIPVLQYDDQPRETVDDSAPDDAEIATAISKMKSGKSPGPSGISADHAKIWLKEYRTHMAKMKEINDDVDCDDDTPQCWTDLVRLIQHIFSTGEIPTKCRWATLVLIPKADGGERGIGLLCTIWKICSSIVNGRIQSAYDFHDTIHGFRQHRGTGTAIAEAKYTQQIAHHNAVPFYEIFLDLSKAYDTLDRDRTLRILQEIGLGPSLRRLLRNYWKSQEIVPKQNGYHGRPFHATRGVTQGDIISPMLFNIVVDVIVRYWLSVESPFPETSRDGIGHKILDHQVLFYADDGLLASTNPNWLQKSFDSLVLLFARMGLKTNVKKTVSMTCTPHVKLPEYSKTAYDRYARNNRGEALHDNSPMPRVECTQCGLEVQQRNLLQHMRSAHGQAQLNVCDKRTPEPAQTFTCSIPKISFRQPVDCPYPNCPGSIVNSGSFGAACTSMRQHFLNRHREHSVTILEEGPLPHCPSCNMQVSHRALNGKHLSTARCKSYTARRKRYELYDRMAEAQDVAFTSNGQTLDRVETFKYLGRPLSSSDDDYPAVVRNLKKARGSWARLSRVLTREGATASCSGMFYKSIVQSVLLYGCETWNLNTPILKSLSGFHNRVLRRIAGKMSRYNETTDTWSTPDIEEVYEECKVYPIEHYIKVRQNSIETFIATRPIREIADNLPERSGGKSKYYLWTNVPLPELRDSVADAEE